MNKPTLSDRTATLLDELKVDQVGLAKIAGVTKGAVNQWKKSKPTATMNPEVAYRIADKTHYNPRWLMLGEGDKTISGNQALAEKIAALPPDRRALLAMIFEHPGPAVETSDVAPVKETPGR